MVPVHDASSPAVKSHVGAAQASAVTSQLSGVGAVTSALWPRRWSVQPAGHSAEPFVPASRSHVLSSVAVPVQASARGAGVPLHVGAWPQVFVYGVSTPAALNVSSRKRGYGPATMLSSW